MKHNQANGENNRDGAESNLSWNCGIEGPTDDPAIESLRNRQVKNLMAVTLLALGTPMILMGDEVRRTQQGNNNAYCQDNDISWFNWGLLARHYDIHRFTKLLIAARMMHGEGDLEELTLNQHLDQAQLEWQGVPELSYVSHSIALTAWSRARRVVFHYMINAYWEPLTFELPSPETMPGGIWHRWIDTSRETPEDIVPWDHMPTITAGTSHLQARSIVILIAKSEAVTL